MGAFELLHRGGPLVWLLLLSGVLALAVTAERWLALAREPRDPEAALATLAAAARYGPGELSAVAATISPATARLVAAAQADLTNDPPSTLTTVRDSLLADLPGPFPALPAILVAAPCAGVAGSLLALVGVHDTHALGLQAGSAALGDALLPGVAGLLVALLAGVGEAILEPRTARVALTWSSLTAALPEVVREAQP